MTELPVRRDLTQAVLAVLFIGILLGGSLWIMRPFIPALIWAATIVITTWPLMLSVQRRCRNRRGFAVAIMTVALLLILVLPLWLAIQTVVENAGTISDWAKTLQTAELATAPSWVARLPWVGPRAAAKWAQVAADREEMLSHVTPYIGIGLRWLVAQAGGVGSLFVHFLLTILLSALLYARGERVAFGVRSFATRLAGPNGEHTAVLAAQAIRAVALGVMVTALVQSLFAGVGLVIAGIPRAFLLTALAFAMSVVQLGVVPVMLVTTIWVYSTGDSNWGTFLLIWTIIAGTLDNFLRPYLIKRGANLPLWLIFAGVIGGLFAFGAIGLFVGPVILAVSYVLLISWVTGTQAQDALKIAGK